MHVIAFVSSTSRCPGVLFAPSMHSQHAPAAFSMRKLYILAYAAGMNTVQSAAGHGSQTADWSGDEDDGMNETICPCDFQHVSLHFGPLLFKCCRVVSYQ